MTDMTDLIPIWMREHRKPTRQELAEAHRQQQAHVAVDKPIPGAPQGLLDTSAFKDFFEECDK